MLGITTEHFLKKYNIICMFDEQMMRAVCTNKLCTGGRPAALAVLLRLAWIVRQIGRSTLEQRVASWDVTAIFPTGGAECDWDSNMV